MVPATKAERVKIEWDREGTGEEIGERESCSVTEYCKSNYQVRTSIAFSLN